MGAIGHVERKVQHCVIALFRDEPIHSCFSNLDMDRAAWETKCPKARHLEQSMLQERLLERMRLL